MNKSKQKLFEKTQYNIVQYSILLVLHSVVQYSVAYCLTELYGKLYYDVLYFDLQYSLVYYSTA